MSKFAKTLKKKGFYDYKSLKNWHLLEKTVSKNSRKLSRLRSLSVEGPSKQVNRSENKHGNTMCKPR